MSQHQSREVVPLIVLEDDPRIRDLLQEVLNEAAGFNCPATYANGEDLLKDLPIRKDAIYLMDIDLGPGIDGIETLRRVRELEPQARVVMLTVHEDSDSVFRALCAGAIGYLIKGIAPARLIAALEEAAAGGAPMSPSIARRVVSTFHLGPKNPLTTREREILRLLCAGESYRMVAEHLFISGHTVRSHIKNIYQKLHVHSRAEAVVKAIRDRLV
ncbi:DNA-binding response regulator [Lewinellaceae bacterium SD302]|nr:DNA-binding response regulator [Lewinellaceae bacterium SD302]